MKLVLAVARNPQLRRLGLAFACFNAAEWAVWIAMLVYAYERGGTTTAGLVALAQLVPAGLFAPMASVLADRFPPGRVLVAGYGAQALAIAATAAVLLADGPPLLAYALAVIAATPVTITRPTQAALLPGIVRTPDELTAANVLGGWVESAAVLAAPAFAGLLLDVAGAGAVFATMAAVMAAATLLVLPIGGPPAAQRGGAPLAETVAGFRLLARDPEPRLVAGLLGAEFVVIGALDVLYVVLALSVLEIGEGGAGYLNAAFGAGGVAAIAGAALLIGRRRLAPQLVASLVLWTCALAALAFAESRAAVFALLVAAGAARVVFDVAARTLLQRIAPAEVLGRVFGVVEGLAMAGLALGSILVPVLVALGGPRAAFLGAAALLPAVLLLHVRALPRVDRRADVPVVESALLRSLPLFAPLRPPELERLARALQPQVAEPNSVVVRKGEPGDRFYVVADGELDVEGRTLRRGDCFGEIALLRDTPRTATVVARTRTSLFSLDRPTFLAALAGNAALAAEADRLVRSRLAPARIAT